MYWKQLIKQFKEVEGNYLMFKQEMNIVYLK